MTDITRMNAAPLGVCELCLADLAVGRRVFHVPLAQGVELFWLHCHHNDTGAHAVRVPAHDDQWHMVHPIDVHQFQQHVAEVERQVRALQHPPAD